MKKIVILLVIVFSVVTTYSQEYEKLYVLELIVIDSNKTPIENANIEVYSSDELIFSSKTDSSGYIIKECILSSSTDYSIKLQRMDTYKR